MTLVSTAAKASGSGSGALTLLFDSLLAAANVTIDTGANGIGQSASQLLVLAHLRSNKAATTDTVTVTFNNDTGANYYEQVAKGFNVTANAASVEAATGLNLVPCSAASAPAGAFTPVTFFVPNYANTTPAKSLTGISGYRASNAAGGKEVDVVLGYYDSTSAITRMAVTCSAQFIAGSRLSIYGLA